MNLTQKVKQNSHQKLMERGQWMGGRMRRGMGMGIRCGMEPEMAVSENRNQSRESGKGHLWELMKI